MRVCPSIIASVFIALTFSPLRAQAAGAVPKVSMGRTVRFREHADTVWRSGRIVTVGNCLNVAPLESFRSGHFMALAFSTVDSVEVRDSTGTAWDPVPTDELGHLRSCKQF